MCFFQFKISLAFLKGCWRYIISVGCPGLVWNNFLAEPKKFGYGILFLLEKMDLEPSYVSFFAEFFFWCVRFFAGEKLRRLTYHD